MLEADVTRCEHAIITADGGHDGLLPGRWKAWLHGWNRWIEAHGATETDAVANLKQTLAREEPRVLWLQSLRVVRARYRKTEGREG